MARFPHAAKTLRRQLIAKTGRKDGSDVAGKTLVPVGDPDGLGVYRTFEIDPVASKGLADALDAIQDSRIVEFKTVGNGKNEHVEVTFASTVRADNAQDFDLAAAQLAAGEDGEE